MTSRFFIAAAFLCLGCSPNAAQPWRKALDEGKVIRLGGSVGRLEPSPPSDTPPTNSPSPPPRTEKKILDPKVGTSIDEQLPVPPPPKSLDGKPRLVIPAEDVPPPKKVDS